MINRVSIALITILGMLGSIAGAQADTEPQVRAQVVLANCAPIPGITELRHRTKEDVEIVTPISSDTWYICHMDVLVDGQEKVLLVVPLPTYPNPGDTIVFDITTYQNHSF